MGTGADDMITLTRLDERVVVLNADLIKMVEATPDTLITFINGDTLMVREPVTEVVRRAIDYARQIRVLRIA
jgi:flagellar protein FlbD